MTKIVSRTEAKRRGLVRYFTGDACTNGHVAERNVREGKCIECIRARQRRWNEDNRERLSLKGRQWREENADRKRANDKAWQEANKQRCKQVGAEYRSRNKERLSESQKNYREKNKTSLYEQKKVYREKNKDFVKEINRRWYRANSKRIIEKFSSRYYADPKAKKKYARERHKQNPDSARTASRNRKARLKGAEGRHTRDDIDRLYVLQKGRCAICFTALRGKFEIDHRMPLSRGGSNDPSNLQLACKPCNLRKRAKDPIAYAQEIGRLL